MEIKKYAFTLLIIMTLLSCNSKKQKPELSELSLNEENTIPLKSKSGGNSEYCIGTVCLNNIDLEKGDYHGSYFIGENDWFQSVYSSQNYETFYQVYAKASFYKDSNIEYLDSIQFRIVNYKGPFDIGFAHRADCENEIDYDNNTIGLKIVVQAMSQWDQLGFDVSSQKIKKDSVNKLNVYRILVPMHPDYLSSSNGGVFDSEFYYRSGLGTTTPRKPVPGQYNYPKDSIGGFKMSDLLESKYFNKDDTFLAVLGDSGICYTSSIYVK